jgi:hypothetical protein
MKLLIVQLTPLSSYVIPLWFKHSLRTLFSNTLSLCSSLKVRDQVSHPYKTTGRITGFYILTFTFLDSKRDDKRLWTEWQQAFPEFSLLLIFFHAVLICECCSQIFECWHIFKRPICFLYAVLLSCLLTTWHQRFLWIHFQINLTLS